MLGFFVKKMNLKDPTKNRFIIKWKNKLDIGDVNISVMTDGNAGFKELVIAFKQAYINTFNIIVMDQ